MKDYTTPELVQSHLGRTLSDVQMLYLAEHILPAVEEWIDSTTGRSFGAGVVTAEILYMSSPYAFLMKAPVNSVQAIRGWYHGQTIDNIQAVNPAYYVLQSGLTGQLYLPSYRSYRHLEVDYTPDAAIPAKVRLAATILAATFMRTVLHPQTEWQTEYSSAQDLRIKFRSLDIPMTVYDLLGSSGNTIVVA